MVARLDERYRRGEKLGSGGMSQVFKAWDTRLKRDVAIKILHDHLAEKEESRRRFSREAEAVAKLHHPNILEIFDFSTEDGRESFIVTEYIKGRTLRDFGDEHRFDPPEIAAMAIHELACALDHAHQKGVIHRDLKPENVMIREDGVLKLMDFGIAKVLDEGDRMTMTGALVGSPAHMAPEIIEGQVATAAADIFSLGTILYWLCCHKLPFIGNNPTQTLKLILDAAYPDPRQSNGACSDELAAIIAKCLAREPKDRYESAQQLRDALAKELARNGLEDPSKEFSAFFHDPAAYRESLKARLIARLLTEAEATSQGPQRNYAKTIKLADRVLALEENNARALALINATRLSQRRRRRLANLGKGAAALGCLALVSFAGVQGVDYLRTHSPPTPEPKPLPDQGKPVAVQPPLPPVDTAPKPPPETPKQPDVVATNPDKPPVDGKPKVETPKPLTDKDKGKKPKEVALVTPVKQPDPTPEPTPASPEVRKVELHITPPLMTATVRIDREEQARGTKPFFFEELPVGEHFAVVECPLCAPKKVPFVVLSEKNVPNHPIIPLPLALRASLEYVADEGVEAVFVDNTQKMSASADMRRFTLDYTFQAMKLEEMKRNVRVLVIRKGRDPQQWTQEISPGPATVPLKAP